MYVAYNLHKTIISIYTTIKACHSHMPQAWSRDVQHCHSFLCSRPAMEPWAQQFAHFAVSNLSTAFNWLHMRKKPWLYMIYVTEALEQTSLLNFWTWKGWSLRLLSGMLLDQVLPDASSPRKISSSIRGTVAKKEQRSSCMFCLNGLSCLCFV